MKSSNNTSLERATSDEKQYRLDILNQVLDEAKNRGDSINENYLLYKMNMKGFHTSILTISTGHQRHAKRNR